MFLSAADTDWKVRLAVVEEELSLAPERGAGSGCLVSVLWGRAGAVGLPAEPLGTLAWCLLQHLVLAVGCGWWALGNEPGTKPF